MVSFDATVSVTSAPEWQRDPRWSGVAEFALERLDSTSHLYVLSAHPDDETLGAGRLIAEAAARGVPTTVVVATGSDQERRDEVQRAARILHPQAELRFLGFPDGALKEHITELADTLHSILRDGDAPASARLALGTWTGDRHGDHRTLGVALDVVAARCGVEAWYYPIWLWQWGTVDDAPWSQLRVVASTDSAAAAKNAAIAQFHSQIDATDGSPMLSAAFLANFTDRPEVLIEGERTHSAATRSTSGPSDTGALHAGSVRDEVLARHFEILHREREDPWAVQTRWYERRKRAITLSALPEERVGSALEIGCSIGVMSVELAARSDSLLAVDGSASAAAAASARLADFPRARAERMQVPDQFPEGMFDLIVLSEIGYYFDPVVWGQLSARCAAALAPGGHVVLCHWLGHASDFAQLGVDAHARFETATGFRRVVHHRDREFELGVWTR